jgi:hypothetical protein
MIKQILTTALALSATFPLYANTWTAETADGVHMASVINDANEISVLCDAGINAPITSINFVVDDVVPMPLSKIALFFDKDLPIYITTDVEGGIGSATQADAITFTQVIDLMKSANKLKVRLFQGSEHTFRLSGSTKAIGNCTPDFNRFTLALN